MAVDRRIFAPISRGVKPRRRAGHWGVYLASGRLGSGQLWSRNVSHDCTGAGGTVKRTVGRGLTG